jgi:uncharacterized protein YbbC (DUF1343 family)
VFVARSGLEVFLDDMGGVADARLGICCNHTAVTRDLVHILPAVQRAGLKVDRMFAPEHGVDALAQDMVTVEDEGDRLRVVSLYGDSEASLRPAPELLSDLDVILFDIQDIGARYYTYQATLGFIMEVAATTGTKVVVLDRPNPIDGVSVEGNIVQPGFESFVSAYPLAVRHGMTMGELAQFFRDDQGIDCDLEVVRCEGWHRDQWLDETDLPWVFPSPNMPTLECAGIYPGMCLIEATNLSEGRGTTRPFHLVGAPWMDRTTFADFCTKGAEEANLRGVQFRPASFEPRFQKHAGVACHGIEMFVSDRNAMEPYLLGLVVLEAALRAAPDDFAWRTETYEFIDDPIAIDLLTGSAEVRVGLESRMRPRELQSGWSNQQEEWLERRALSLLY